jgi:hypothetical protein
MMSSTPALPQRWRCLRGSPLRQATSLVDFAGEILRR